MAAEPADVMLATEERHEKEPLSHLETLYPVA